MNAKDTLSLAISCLALIFSISSFYIGYSLNYNQSVKNVMPVLVFEYDGEIGWKLLNIGSGPALNVLVAQKKQGGAWFNPVRVPPLARDSTFIPTWLGHVNTTGLGATYMDVDGRQYSSTTGNDLTDIHQHRVFGPWNEAKIGKYWSQPPYHEE